MTAGSMENIARAVCEVHGHHITSFLDGNGGYVFFCTACGMPLNMIREKPQYSMEVASAIST